MDHNEQNHRLPFKIGQLAESRSFIAGFRAAWFRCKIKDIKLRKGQIAHLLEFFDFPDEKLRWTQLYQKNPSDRYLPPKEKKLHLMVRPQFPPLYSESQMPNLHQISGVLAIVVDEWKVGDLVDWWYDGCFWSGKIICLLGDDRVQIELPKPPLGEGKSYEAFCKDLRPSLDWSPKDGWTVPTSTMALDRKNGRYCARLIRSFDQGADEYSVREDNVSIAQGESGDSSEYAAMGSSYSSADSFLPPTGPSHLPSIDALKRPTAHEVTGNGMLVAHTSKSLDRGHSFTSKGSCSDGTSLPPDKAAADAFHAMTSVPRVERYEQRGPSKKMRIGEDEKVAPLFRCDTIESSIMGLEELASKIKWVKGILQFGPQLSDSVRPSWKFLENHTPMHR